MATSLSRAADHAHSGGTPKLHLLTYLVPGLPLDLFVTYQRLFEEALECESYMSVEPRWSAPPKGREDIFTANEIDVAFMCSTGYVRMSEMGINMELLGVAPLYDHLGVNAQPYYYSDVIMLKDRAIPPKPIRKKDELSKVEISKLDIIPDEELLRPKYKEFLDLRGHKWATNDCESMSGNIAMLSELKKIGSNASFFGNIIYAGNHRASIDAVLNSVADAACVDSNVLQLWKEENPRLKDKVHILCTWGPWPIQPIVVNSRLPVEVKEKMATALLESMDHPELGPKFRKYCIKGFKRVDSMLYNRAKEVIDLAKNENMFPAYY